MDDKMEKRAVILAGGMGTRLRPYTTALPKPLMPVGDFPILEVIVRQLARAGFEHITLAVNHQAHIIKAYFGNGERWGVPIDYSMESKPLSTMGPLKLIPDLPENFLVMNGDVLTDVDFAAFMDEHQQAGKLFSILAHMRTEKVDYGVLEVDENGNLCGFMEKPENQYRVSMGIYGVNQKALDYIPENEKFGFDDLMGALLKARVPARTVLHPGYWLDIGRPDDYMRAVDEFEQMKSRFM